jgi:L,D-peptidoglycan transpeptidase YkuD (ErfK/YbiS/YcfS/YnhG family)
MPSSFDEFSERSHLTYMGATSEALRNRQILQTAMQQAGFLSMTTEWWHFDSPDWQRFPLANADSRLVPRADVAQILAVERPKQGETVSVMWGFEKTSRGWETVLGPIAVSLGRNGIAAFDQKKEGDGMTPRGVFALGPVFGYAAKADTRMPYRQATEQDVWIDEPASPRYNQWVQGIPSRESHEKMRRVDHLYQLGVVVGYNTAPVVAGKGSAIFLHVWKGPGATTSGCVAMELSDLARIISWLAPDKNPQIILGYQGD